MAPPATSTARRLCLLLALLVPLVVDPLAEDTLALKRLVLAAAGLGALLAEGLELLSRREVPRPLRLPEGLLLLMAIWASVGLLWAPNPQLTLLEAALLFGLVGLLRARRAACPEDEDVRRGMCAMVALGLVAIGADALLVAQRTPELSVSRAKFASALFTHNNIAAAYAVLLAPLGLGLLAASRRWWTRLLGALPLVVVPLYVIQLRSRAGLLAVAFGLGVTAWMLWRRRSARAPISARSLRTLGAAIIVAGLMPLLPAVRMWGKARFYEIVAFMEEQGLGELADSSMRTGLYRRTLDMVIDSEWLGVGAGNFAVLIRRYDAFFAVKPHAHNDSLHLLAELGLPGLLLFLGLLAAVVLQLLRILRSRDDAVALCCASGLLGSVVAFGVTGLLEVPFRFGASAALFILIVGLAGRLEQARAPRRHRTERSPAFARLMVVIGLVGIFVVGRRMPASWFVARAETALAAGDTESARADYEIVAALGTGYALPHMALADLALDAGDGATAMEQLAAAEDLWPESVELWRAQAQADIRLDQPERAVERLRRAEAASPSHLPVLLELVHALGEAGRTQEAIDRLEFRVHTERQQSTETLVELTRLYQRHALAHEGLQRRLGWIGMRHFLAVVLDHGAVEWREWANDEFKHATHQLQLLPGSPDSWWPDYQRWLADGGWDLPNSALWTGFDPGDVKLYPGWEESAGPPLPLHRR